MASVLVERVSESHCCDNCNTEIEATQVAGKIILPHCKGNFILCEDCFNDLMNDINDEYCRFCDQGK